jgi:gluconokinase
MPVIKSTSNIMIGVDIGTSSTKVIAYSDKGKVLTIARRSYPLLQPHAGYAEQDPETLYRAVTESITEVCIQLKGKADIEGFSFSSAMHGFLALDKENKPLTQVITWADTRSSGEAEKLKKHPGAKKLYERTGVPMHPMTPLTKICWLQDTRPDLAANAAMYSGIKEYILFRLMGVHVIDHSLASATGMFDIHSLQWYKPALEMAGITENQLPNIVSTTYALYKLDPVWREKWGLAENIPFYCGASDGCLANLGTGAVETGDLAVTVGTSGAVRMAASKAMPDRFSRTFNYVLTPSLYIAGGPVNNGGIILKWFTENFLNKPFSGAADFDDFLEEAGKAPPGSAGLICLPYFMGERAPVWNAHLKGIFYGIQLHHKREHMMRSIVEGISFSLLQIAEILTESQGPYTRIFASGGFVHSSSWMQLLSDIFNRTVHITQTEDASAIGAAMLGWMALGRIRDIEQTKQWIDIQQTYHPNPTAHELYRNSFEQYKILSAQEATKKSRQDFTA